jgi:hypothetical protein
VSLILFTRAPEIYTRHCLVCLLTTSSRKAHHVALVTVRLLGHITSLLPQLLG